MRINLTSVKKDIEEFFPKIFCGSRPVVEYFPPTSVNSNIEDDSHLEIDGIWVVYAGESTQLDVIKLTREKVSCLVLERMTHATTRHIPPENKELGRFDLVPELVAAIAREYVFEKLYDFYEDRLIAALKEKP